MDDVSNGSAAEVLKLIVSALESLDKETRTRVLHSVETFFGETPLAPVVNTSNIQTETIRNVPAFSNLNFPSPKQFLMEKQPHTDVERVGCLAYYLTHYRDTPFFKTLDLSKLNTEAAQPKFANAAYASNNALKMGYLVPASKGQRQISAAGEQFVAALPDRDAAKQAMARARPRRRMKKRNQELSNANDSDIEEQE